MRQGPDFDEPLAHQWVWAVYAILFVVSIPWYLPSGATVPFWFGLPYWVVISLVACLCIAIFTAWVVSRYWQ